MKPRFAAHGKPIPPFRVGTGFTSGGQYCNAGGECWNKSVSADAHYEIFIMPDRHEVMEIAAILCHELIHAAVGLQEGHKGEFAKMMCSLGLLRPYTQSIPGPEFEAWVQPELDRLGPIPHAPLRFSRVKGLPAPSSDEGEPAEVPQEAEKPSSNAKKKQSTRMLKAQCEECGYTVRLTKMWALKLGAVCPEHGGMKIEGLNTDDA